MVETNNCSEPTKRHIISYVKLNGQFLEKNTSVVQSLRKSMYNLKVEAFVKKVQRPKRLEARRGLSRTVSGERSTVRRVFTVCIMRRAN